MKQEAPRKCPGCGEPTIDVKQVYPEGFACPNCGSHVEVNLSAIVLVVGGLMAVMFVDLRFYDTGIGLVAVFALMYIGLFYPKVYPRFFPLKRYDD